LLASFQSLPTDRVNPVRECFAIFLCFSGFTCTTTLKSIKNSASNNPSRWANVTWFALTKSWETRIIMYSQRVKMSKF